MGALTAGLFLSSTVLTACGGSEEPADPPPREESTTETSSEAPTEEPTEKPSDGGEESPTTEPTASESPGGGAGSGTKAGDTVQVENATFTIPEGFEAMAEAPAPAKAALQLEGGDPTVNFNFIVTPVGGADLKALLPEMKKALTQQADDLTEVPETTVDGAPAAGLKGTFKQGGYPLTQMYILKDDKVYIITLVSVDASKAATGDAALKSLLDSWKFA